MSAAAPAGVSIVIKALNEEARIARAIESALAAAPEVAPLPLEVVLADACSDDRTVEIARRYPVRIVQFTRVQDRGCGAGVQLGYSWARGDWIYLMDGDMVLAPGFLGEALRRLVAEPTLGGVGGGVVDERIRNAFDLIRVKNRSGTAAGRLPWLEGGGLYRRAAIERAGGYAADRNLRGYEEAELGLRLGSAGFALERLPRPAVSHRGHDLGMLALLARHWRSRRAMSAGVMLRAALGQPWWRAALRLHRHPLFTLAWWLALAVGLLLAPAVAPAAWVAASLAGVALLWWHKRDPRHVAASLVGWHHAAAAIVVGWFEPRIDPREPIASRVLHEHPADGAAA